MSQFKQNVVKALVKREPTENLHSSHASCTRNPFTYYSEPASSRCLPRTSSNIPVIEASFAV